jgi:translocation protein SEC62
MILMLVMFPIWPYEVKYGIWLVSLVLLIILVGIIVIRLVVYLVIVVFNYHIWIFPNFLNSTGFWDSFIPFIEVSKGDKSWLNVFIRLFAISSFILLVLHVYLNPTFIDGNYFLIQKI